MKKRKSRIKILPSKVFHKLWDVANKDFSLPEYVDYFTFSENRKTVINFKKYNLDYVETLDMLKSVYTLAHYSFKDILALGAKKKSQVSDIFCIPIRTVEEWYTGNNKCSSYIRLMLLKEFHLLDLGNKYIKLESEILYLKTIPSIYEHHEESGHENIVPVQGPSEKNKKDDIDKLCGELSFRYVPQRTEEERAFFKKYGFYPNNNVTWD